MKKELFPLIIPILAIVMAGCSGGGGGTGTTSGIVGFPVSSSSNSLTIQEMSAVEASLVASRLLAASEAEDLPDCTQASGTDLPPFHKGGHRFHGGRCGDGWKIRNGSDSCEVKLEHIGSGPARVWIGSHHCTASQSTDGAITITHADGRTVTLVPPVAGSATSSLIVGSSTWTLSWGGEVLVTLKNDADGFTMTIAEDDEGLLTIRPVGKPPHRAHWMPDGSIEAVSTGDGTTFRFCEGRFK